MAGAVERFRPKITPVATTVYREKEIALTAIVFSTMNALAWSVLVAAMGRTMEEMENMPGMQHSHQPIELFLNRNAQRHFMPYPIATIDDDNDGNSRS